MNASPPIKIKNLPLLKQLKGNDAVDTVKRVFRCLSILVLIGMALYISYFLFASDRYVSKAIVQIQTTQNASDPSMDITALITGGAAGMAAMADQLLLREHLMSVDMLKKLDKEYNLRAHFSDSSHDIASRMWFEDASIEWFHRHFLNRVSIEFDEYAGVLRIDTQAYDPKMARDITATLVKEGERYMNELSHDLARAQMAFLEMQVENAQKQMQQARSELLEFQNKKGLASPKSTLESIHKILEGLEGQRTKLQTQIAALPANLDRNHPTRKSLTQSLRATEKQIAHEKARLAANTGKPLNSLVEEENRLALELEFKQDVYKSALLGLEKGRIDAARAIKRVSVLQSPTEPEYAWEPRRIWGVTVTLILGLLILGMVNLLRSVVLDHVD